MGFLLVLLLPDFEKLSSPGRYFPFSLSSRVLSFLSP